MFKSLAPVNKERHAGKKIRQIEGFGFASDFHIASLMVHEFVRAAGIYPVVFLEDKENDRFRPVALLGLEAGENLFIGDDSKSLQFDLSTKRNSNPLDYRLLLQYRGIQFKE